MTALYRFRLTLAAVFCGAVALTLMLLRPLAYADAGPPAAAGFDWQGTVAVIALVMGGLGTVLGGVSAILHAIAPRAKSATVERMATDIDAAHGKLDQLLGIVNKLKPPAAMLAVLLLGALLAGPLLACATLKADAAAGKTSVVDCVKGDRTAIEALLGELAWDGIESAARLGAPDWDALVAKAEARGVAIGGCALVELEAARKPPVPSSGTAIAALSTPPPAPDPATAALERVRANFGGVQWRTAGGVR